MCITSQDFYRRGSAGGPDSAIFCNMNQCNGLEGGVLLEGAGIQFVSNHSQEESQIFGKRTWQERRLVQNIFHQNWSTLALCFNHLFDLSFSFFSLRKRRILSPTSSPPTRHPPSPSPASSTRCSAADTTTFSSSSTSFLFFRRCFPSAVTAAAAAAVVEVWRDVRESSSWTRFLRRACRVCF